MYICPQCHKQLKNKHSLDSHMKRFNHVAPQGGAKATPAPKTKPQAKPKPTAKKFELKAPKEEKTTYKCGACQATLPGELSRCPACGAALTWE